MSPSRDPFGFSSKPSPQSPQGTNPLVVVAQPGQEIRVIVTESGGLQADTGLPSSPSHSPDSGLPSSPSHSPDSGLPSSPSHSPDSGLPSSPSHSPDALAQNPFGFNSPQRAFSPSPITVVASRGQEIRIVVPNQPGSSGT
jgi:hypothetical protein